MHKDNKDDLRKLFVGLDKKVNVEGKGRIIPITLIMQRLHRLLKELWKKF